MSSEKTNEDNEIQWQIYKNQINTNEQRKFLRSSWRNEVKDIKAAEIKEIATDENKKILPLLKPKHKKKSSSKNKNKNKKIKLSKTNLLGGSSKKVKHEKEKSFSKNGSESVSSYSKLIKNGFNSNAINDFSIDFNDNENNINFNNNNKINGPYDIVPYNSYKQSKKSKLGVNFNLYDKMRYNKVIKRDSFKGRIVIVKREDFDGEVKNEYARIEEIIDEEIRVSLIEEYNNEENEAIDFNFQAKDIFNKDTHTAHILINCNENNVYLIEYMFEYKTQISSDRKTNLNKDHLTYALITSKFNASSSKVDLLLEGDEYFNLNKIKYSGFLVKEDLILDLLIKIDCRDLIVIDQSHFKNKLISHLYEDINLNYKKFIQVNEYQEEVNELNILEINLNNFLLHEILISFATKENDYFSANNDNNNNIKKLCLLLQYNSSIGSIYIRDYRTNGYEWVSLDSLFKKSGCILINSVKGCVILKSLVNLSNSISEFYKYIQFAIFENIPLENNPFNYNIILVPKILSDNKFILNEAECNICTYRIGEFENRHCKFCNKVFHIQCLSAGDRITEQISNIQFWACQQCRPCKNCHNNLNTPFEKLYCKDCHSCYHLSCLNSNIVCKYPLASEASGNNQWRCENCLKCETCGVEVLKKSFSSNYQNCTDCEKRFEKKEFCPVCSKLWNETTQNMIECKCKFWVHKECDRILTDEYFKKLTKKTYHCPVCRIKKKNKQIGIILYDLIKQDKSSLFYNPVDADIIVNYSKIIKTPMCFAFIEKKLNKSVYLDNMNEFSNDVELIFSNAMSFNMPNTQIYKLAEAALANCQVIFEVRISELLLISLEYFLFDFNPTDLFFANEPETFFTFLEQKIRNKFNEQLDKIKTKNGLLQKLNEYKLNWEFPKDFIEKHFIGNTNSNDTGNISANNYTGNETNSVYSESPRYTAGRIIVPKLIVDENIASNSNNNMMIDEDEDVSCKNSKNQIEDNFGNMTEKLENFKIQTNSGTRFDESDENVVDINKSEKDIISIEEDNGFYEEGKYNFVNNNNISSSSKIQIKLEDDPNFEIPFIRSNSVLSQTNNNIIIKKAGIENLNYESSPTLITDFNTINNFGVNDTLNTIHNANTLNNEFQNKKRDRVKSKINKTSDFQHELDTYNSNFEFHRKHSKSNVPQLNHKMEINENDLDIYNPFLALEEEEESISKVFDKVKLADPSLFFLYPNKFKLYIQEKDKDCYSAYLHMLTNYVHLKDDKKKKVASEVEKKKAVAVAVEAEEYSNEYEDYDEQKLIKNKKGRPSKTKEDEKKKEKEKEKVVNSQSNKTNLKNKTSKHSNMEVLEKTSAMNKQSSYYNNSNNINANTKTSNLSLTLLTNSSSNANPNRFKSEAELFEENINQKSLLPLPAQICFSQIELIFEKNCYLCGSFDDTNLFLSCSICYENFHSYCITSSPMITQNIEQIKNYKWKCQNCKFCEGCKTNENDNLLLYCDSCDRAMHTYCLDVKLSVVPESGWKCLTCFKCQNCKTDKYYKTSFPIKKDKDYSPFTRNFNYCFECGLTLLHHSFCNKCQKSDFKKINTNLVFLENRDDYFKNENVFNFNINKEAREYIIMLHCSICSNWFHSDCLGIDDKNIKFYFDEFETFKCLDCHMMQKYNDRYLEATYCKYLQVLQMSFTVMTFSRLIMIILKSICADSSFKLHSKLLKLYLKENFNMLLKDKNMCMLLELIKNDLHQVKGKPCANKSKKKKNDADIKNNNCNNSESEMNNKIDNNENIIDAEIQQLNCTYDFYELDKSVERDLVNKQKIDSRDLIGFVKKFEIDKHKEKLTKDNIKKPKRIFNINSSGDVFNSNKHNKTFYESIEYNDPLKSLSKITDYIPDVNFNNKKEVKIFYGFETITKVQDQEQEQDEVNEISIEMDVEKYLNSSEHTILNNHNKANKEDNITIIEEDVKMENKECDSLSVTKEIEDKLIEGELMKALTSNSNAKDNFETKKKRPRISLIADRQLKEELETFFKKDHDVTNLNAFNEDKYVNFYKFDMDQYYKGGDGYKSKPIPRSKISSDSNLLDGNKLTSETIEKLEPYLKLKTFSKRIRKFIFNLILTVIVTLKQSLLKWLLAQMTITNDNSLVSNSQTSKKNIYQYWSNYQTYYNLNNSSLNLASDITGVNSIDYSEEEVTKFLDFIDPLEDSPSRNIQCEFCLRRGARKFSGRLIYIKTENWGHTNCILWSKSIQESSDGNLLNVSQMMNKVKLFKCSFCRKYGATICCDSRKCGKNYHFACAHAKQCVFTEKKQFYCYRCASTSGNKEEVLPDFNTYRRFIVVKNQDFVNDYKYLNYSIVNTDNPSSPNVFRILPKYLIGSLNKFGNTTVIKCLQINKKDLAPELLDFAVVKYLQKPNLEGEMSEHLLLLTLNESVISFSNLNFNKNNAKELEEILNKAKLLNPFEKSEVDLEVLREMSKGDRVIHKAMEMSLNMSNYTKEKFDISSQLEEYLKQTLFSEDKMDKSRWINKKYYDWMSLFNVYLPFNIIMKYQGLYLKLVTEYTDQELKQTKECQNKIAQYTNIIKSKNRPFDNMCFKFTNYIESHQQQIFKRSVAEQEYFPETFQPGDRRASKTNKQIYKNLNRTMSTNIMDMDLPLAMKFRNYKSLKPRVTIGPSTIHRNGLFTTESFSAGEIVIEYVGELITNKIADFREKEYNLRGFGDCYMFRLDQQYIIDATKYGNLARFINHCCDPSCSAQTNQIGDKKHIILYAKRPIKAQEEITYDYNFECEQEKIMCRCGAINCQGRLN